MRSNSSLFGKLDAIAEICRRHHVRGLYLLGSATRSDFRSDSDFDFLVEFDARAVVGLLALGALQEELEALLERKVDLAPKRGLKPLIRERVLEQSEPVYAG